MSGIRHQGVICQGLPNSEKVRLSRGIILIQPRLWSTRDPDLRRHQVTSGNEDIIPSWRKQVCNQQGLTGEGKIKT